MKFEIFPDDMSIHLPPRINMWLGFACVGLNSDNDSDFLIFRIFHNPLGPEPSILKLFGDYQERKQDHGKGQL
jgi:hypothetical protein